MMNLERASERKGDVWNMRVSVLGVLLLGTLLLGPSLRTFFIPYDDIVGTYLSNIHIVLFCLVFAVLYILTYGLEDKRFFARDKALSGLFLIWLVSASYSSWQAIEPGPSWFKYLQYILYAVFGAFLYEVFKRERHLKSAVFPALILGFFLYLVFFGLGVSQLTPEQFQKLTWFTPGFINVRVFAFYLVVLIVAVNACFLLFHAHKGRLFRLGYFALLIAVWGMLLWTGGRGAVLSLAAASFASALIIRRPWVWKIIAVNAVSAVIGGAGSLLFPVPDGSFGVFRFATTVTERESVNAFSSGRITLWTEALEAWWRAPFFGWGSGQTKSLLPAAGGVFAQPHNFVVNALFSWGVVGGIPFIAFIGLLLWRAGRAVLAAGLAVPGAAGFVIALALGINAFIDGSLFQTFPLFFFTLGAALALSSTQEKEGSLITA